MHNVDFFTMCLKSNKSKRVKEKCKGQTIYGHSAVRKSRTSIFDGMVVLVPQL